MPLYRLPSAFAPLSAFAVLSLAALMPVAASAAPAGNSAQVVVGGTLIHTIRTTWAGHTPQQRADEVQQRLIVALAKGPVRPQDITVAKLQDDWCVLCRGQRLVTADALAARQQHSAPAALAQEWAVRLRQVLPDLMRSQAK